MSEGPLATTASARDLDRARVRAELRTRLFGAVEAGVHVGRFRLLRKLGAGATGMVFAAADPTLGRQVALKLLLAGGDQQAALTEARAMARLAHPNLLPVFEVGQDGDRGFLVTELIEGGSARAWLGEPRTWAARVQLVRGVIAGVAEAHRRGLIHRDLKPENVLVGADGRARVADFGLAVSFRGVAPSDGTGPGTPTYMAPEQAAGQPADPRSDQYAVCLIAREVLFGVSPSSPGDVSVSADAIAAPVLAVLRRGLAQAPEARWPSVDALAAAFEVALAPRRPRGWHLLVAIAALAVVLGGGAWALTRGEGPRASSTATASAPPPAQTALAADRDLLESMSPLLLAGRYQDCVAALRDKVRSDAGRSTWLRCAEQVGPAAVDEACDAWRRTSADTSPAECSATVRAARARQTAGDLRGCLDALEAAAPTRAGYMLASQCAAPLDDADQHRRVCRYAARLEGDAAKLARCDSPPE